MLAYAQLRCDQAAPTIVYFVRPHNEKKWTKQRTFTGEQLQRRNIQLLLCKWECYNATYITPLIRHI